MRLPTQLTREDRAADEARASERLRFYGHLVTYGVVMSLLLRANLSASPWHLWFLWPLLVWGIAVAVHAIRLFVRDWGLYRRMIDHETNHSRL